MGHPAVASGFSRTERRAPSAERRGPSPSAILRGMADTEPVADAATMRLFVAVLVCEALTILALWAFGRYFS